MSESLFDLILAASLLAAGLSSHRLRQALRDAVDDWAQAFGHGRPVSSRHPSRRQERQ